MDVKRLIAIIWIMFLCVSVCLTGTVRSAGAEDASNPAPLGSYASYMERYAEFMGKNTDAAELTVPAAEAFNLGPDAILREDGVLCFNKGQAYADFSFDVERSGFYRIVPEYAQTLETNKQISFGILVDQAYPFQEAVDVAVPRIFIDQGEIRTDTVGNEITPKQAQVLDMQLSALKNTNGYPGYERALSIQSMGKARDASIILKDLKPNASFVLERMALEDTATYVWNQMGRPENLTPCQEKLLRAVQPAKTWLQVDPEGVLNLPLVLKPWEVACLYQID